VGRSVLVSSIRHLDNQSTWLDEQRYCEVADDCVCVHGQTQSTQSCIQRGFPDRFIPLHLGGPPDIVHENVQTALFVLDSSHEGVHLAGHEMVYHERYPTASSLIHKSCGSLRSSPVDSFPIAWNHSFVRSHRPSLRPRLAARRFRGPLLGFPQRPTQPCLLAMFPCRQLYMMPDLPQVKGARAALHAHFRCNTSDNSPFEATVTVSIGGGEIGWSADWTDGAVRIPVSR
jgi:hypothetical protein